MSPRRSAFVQASVPLALGIGGMAKLGHFNTGVFIATVVAAMIAYQIGYHRAKYGTAPRKSVLFGEIPGGPPER